jgi:hypothetical protein
MAIDYPPVFINNYLADKISQELPNYFSNNLRFFPTQPTSIDTFTEDFPESAEEPFAVYDRMFRMRRGPFPHIRTEQLLYYFYKTAGGMEALIETVQAVADLLDNGDESATDVNRWIERTLTVNTGDFATKKTLSLNQKSISSGVVTIQTSEYHGFKVGDIVKIEEVSSLTGNNTNIAGTHTISEIASSTEFSFELSVPDADVKNTQPGATVGIAYPTVRFGDKDFFLPYFHEFKIYQLEEARDIVDFGTARTYAGNKIIIEYTWHKTS